MYNCYCKKMGVFTKMLSQNEYLFISGVFILIVHINIKFNLIHLFIIMLQERIYLNSESTENGSYDHCVIYFIGWGQL